MEFRWQGLNHRLHFSFEKVEQVTGGNSNIDKDTHVLMWDFDNIPLAVVYNSLVFIQCKYILPPIQVLSTGKENGYHAYCFKVCTFLLARTIIASTPNVDLKYVALGLMRGYFTLRFSDVKGRTFEPIRTLPSEIVADCSYKDVNCFVNYTKRVK